MQTTIGTLPGEGDALPFEVVERKGLGHPDTICDALAEQVSLRLSRFYVEQFGLILHHNVDKVLLVGGESVPAFGGGVIRAPIEIVLAGRATREFRGVPVPIDMLAEDACRTWLAAHLHALDAGSVQIRVRIHPGSPDLVDLYLRQRRTGMWLANDTSCGVGFAPLSRLERAVIAAEYVQPVPCVFFVSMRAVVSSCSVEPSHRTSVGSPSRWPPFTSTARHPSRRSAMTASFMSSTE
jgi:S-adenosylmethionine synthetase